MKIWIITQRHEDNSGERVLDTAYTDQPVAEHIMQLLKDTTPMLYEIKELSILGTSAAPVKTTPIEVLNLTMRTEHALKADNIFTVERLMQLPANTLLKIPNLGRRSLDEIRDSLRVMNLDLRP